MQGHVLVVDDDAGAVELMAERLRQAGIDVRAETDAARALETTLGDNVDVVVSDLRMQPMDGITFCEKVTSARPDIPVVLVTGHATTDAEAGAYRAGAFDFMTKPTDGPKFVSAVERALRHHQLTQEVSRSKGHGSIELPGSVEELVSAAELERRYVAHVLTMVKGNKSKAARILGFDRRTLYRKLERTAHQSQEAQAATSNGSRTQA